MKTQILIILMIPMLTISCSINSASKVAPDGTYTKYYAGAIGGKGGAVHGDSSQGGLSMVSFYDNEKSFRDAIVGAVTYGLGTVIGSAVEAGQVAKTARHAATTAQQTAAAKSAAEAAALAEKAALLKAIPPEGGLIAAPITL